MFKIGLTVIVVLGVLLCTSLLQTAESQETEPDKTKTAKIRVPDKGVTIVLRAPTSENYHLVKVSKGRDGKLKRDVIEGLTVSLPKDTPVFFMVDHVNTILYNVEISVAGQGPNDAGTGGNVAQARDKSNESLGTEATVNSFAGELSAMPEAEKPKIETVLSLNSTLDALLYESEKPKFYKVDPDENDKRFKEIQTKAKDTVSKAFKVLGVTADTSEEVRSKAEEVITAVHAAYKKACKTPSEALLKSIREALAKTADKLQAIEAATWFKRDTEDRVLIETLKYTCKITPNTQLSKKYAELPPKPRVVTVSTMVEDLSGFNVTVGPLISGVSDESYVNINEKIVPGSQEAFSKQLGVFAHLPLWSCNSSKFRVALGISGGVAGFISLENQALKIDFKSTEPALGVSVLLASKTGNNLLVLTVGGMVRSVKRLNGYCVGDPYPSGELMRATNEMSGFCAITYSYDVIEKLKNWGLR